MLDKPGVIETVNRETIPVKCDATDRGLPPGIPALQTWYDHYETNPYARMIYGHFVILDPEGKRVYGISSNQFEEQWKGKLYDGAHEYLKDYIARFKKYRALEAKLETDPTAKDALAKLEREIEIHKRKRFACSRDTRLTTARFLLNYGAHLWDHVMEYLIPPDRLQPGLRSGVVQALGDFLTNDAPWDEYAEHDVRMIYRLLERDEANGIMDALLAKKPRKEWRIGDIPIPPSLRRKAAVSLGRIVGQGWKDEDPQLVAKARTWWNEHRDDPEWEVKWADPPNGWASVEDAEKLIKGGPRSN